MLRVLAIACLLLRAAPTSACATAPPRGEEAKLADEDSLIIWDAKNHLEHFVRKAAFHTTARSFGFLVPTPSVPQLAEMDDAIFRSLEDAIRPAVRYEHKGFVAEPMLLAACMLGGMAKQDDASKAEPVRVVQFAHVAGYDATTLAADDPTALAGWLEQHGFARTPEFETWLGKYTASHWKITAFVVAGDQNEVATKTVRMTIAVDAPFYPYREPAGTKIESRLMRLYFVSTERVAATVGGAPWAAKVIYGASIPKLDDRMPAQPVATVFEDSTAERPDDELAFARAPDQTPLHQPDVIVNKPHKVPFDLIILVGIIALVITARRLRTPRPF